MGRIEMILLTQRDILAMNIGIGQVISLVEAGIGEHGRGRVENPPEPGLHATPNFLAEVSAPSPDAHEKPTLFHGGYPRRTRGDRKRHGLLGVAPPTEPAPEGDTRAPLEARRSWARLLRQVLTTSPSPIP